MPEFHIHAFTIFIVCLLLLGIVRVVDLVEIKVDKNLFGECKLQVHK